MKKILVSLSKHKRALIVTAAVLALLLIHNRLIFPQTPESSRPQFATVERRDIKVTLAASGIFTGRDTASLHFKTPGKLSFVNAKPGDQVFAGEVLANLDSRELSIQAQQAQNSLRDKQAALDKVLDDIHLFQYGNGGFANVGSENETMAQRQLRTGAEVARDNAFDSIRLAQVALSDTVLTTPISGIVTKANFFPGQVIGATDTIEIVDFSQPTFEADVDESDVAKISPGQKAEVTLNAYGDKTFTGKVSEITSLTHTTSNGATVVGVKVSLQDPSIKKIAGLNGQVNIVTDEKLNTLSIPVEALREDNTVLIKTLEGIEARKVETGFKSDTDVEITEGLKESDQVVINPTAVSESLENGNPLSRIFGSR